MTALAMIGETDRARALCQKLLSFAGPLGLYGPIFLILIALATFPISAPSPAPTAIPKGERLNQHRARPQSRK